MRLAVVTAGLSQPSSTRLLADRLAQAVRQHVEGELEIVVIELRELAGDLANHLVTGFPSPGLRAALATVETADGLIAVTPIFAASYSGLFKSFFDVLEDGVLRGKPVLIAATGGTARHSLALEHAMRPLFSYLRAFVVPTAVYAAPEDWGAGHDATGDLAERIARGAGELAELMSGRPSAPAPADTTDEVIPFEQQLAALRAE